MSDDYKDLDALVATDKNVKLGGKRYTLPGDLPLEIYIRVNKASALSDEDEKAALDLMVDAMVDLFAHLYLDKPEEPRVRDDVRTTLTARGISFNTSLLQNIYSEDVSNKLEVVRGEVEGPTK